MTMQTFTTEITESTEKTKGFKLRVLGALRGENDGKPIGSDTFYAFEERLADFNAHAPRV